MLANEIRTQVPNGISEQATAANYNPNPNQMQINNTLPLTTTATAAAAAPIIPINSTEENTKVNCAQYEGKRVQQLRKTVHMALEKTLPHCNMNTLAPCFSNLNEVQYNYLNTVFNELKVFLRSSVKDELDLIMEETNVCYKLNELDELQKKADENNQPTHKGERKTKAPDVLIRNQSMPAKLKYKEQLLELLKGEEEKHQQLLNNVSEKRKKVTDLRNQIDNVDCDFINKGLQTTTDYPAQQIGETIDQIQNLL